MNTNVTVHLLDEQRVSHINFKGDISLVFSLFPLSPSGQYLSELEAFGSSEVIQICIL